jgi:hypothetical protein
MFDQHAHNSTDKYLKFLAIFQTLYLLLLLSAEPRLGNFILNSGKISLKVTLFNVTSKCSHIIDSIGRWKEDIKKSLIDLYTLVEK